MEFQIKWKANPKIRRDFLSQQHSRQRILGIFAIHTLTVGLTMSFAGEKPTKIS